METATVLRYGTPVILTRPDMDAFLGREKHPTTDDIGFVGTVVANEVEFYDEHDYTSKKNVLGGTSFVASGPDDIIVVIYTVRAPDGRELELVEHEIEVV